MARQRIEREARLAAAEARRLALKRQDDIILALYWAACIALGGVGLWLILYILWKSNV